VNGDNSGSFLLLDAKTFEVRGTWPDGDKRTEFGYDFWYQPRHNVMLSTEWGSPNKIKQVFNVNDVEDGFYGNRIHVWDWATKTLKQSLTLEGPEGLIPLEVRFMHDPTKCHAFVGTALGSAIYHIYKDESDSGDGQFKSRLAVSVPSKRVDGWAMEEMPALTTDIIVSMDDHFLYASNWIHGDVRQYDIRDPFNIRLVGHHFIGGSIQVDSGVKVVEDRELKGQPEPVVVCHGLTKVEGGPQMLQLSLDGKRLYVTTSLYSVWDKQFYPNLTKNGATMVQLDVDTDGGGLKLNRSFCVDFSALPNGPFLAHEMRYPGGDCTSDIWL